MTIRRLSSATLQLPSSTGTLYTVPAGRRTSLTITLHNTSVNAVVVSLFWPGTATSQRRIQESIPANATVMIEPKLPITLEAGETLSGSAATGSVVNVEITGAEEVA